MGKHRTLTLRLPGLNLGALSLSTEMLLHRDQFIVGWPCGSERAFDGCAKLLLGLGNEYLYCFNPPKVFSQGNVFFFTEFYDLPSSAFQLAADSFLLGLKEHDRGPATACPLGPSL